jgi:hypothetical protein
VTLRTGGGRERASLAGCLKWKVGGWSGRREARLVKSEWLMMGSWCRVCRVCVESNGEKATRREKREVTRGREDMYIVRRGQKSRVGIGVDCLCQCLCLCLCLWMQ